MAPAAAARNRSLGRPRDPPARALRPGREELAALVRRTNTRRIKKRGPGNKIATVERREASVPTAKGRPRLNSVVWSRFASATGLRRLGAPLPVWGERKREKRGAAREIQRSRRSVG